MDACGKIRVAGPEPPPWRCKLPLQPLDDRGPGAPRRGVAAIHGYSRASRGLPRSVPATTGQPVASPHGVCHATTSEWIRSSRLAVKTTESGESWMTGGSTHPVRLPADGSAPESGGGHRHSVRPEPEDSRGASTREAHLQGGSGWWPSWTRAPEVGPGTPLQHRIAPLAPARIPCASVMFPEGRGAGVLAEDLGN